MTPRTGSVVATCSCGLAHTRESWSALPRVGVQPTHRGGSLALRNCSCGSTRAVCGDCGTDGCGCKGCGALCGDEHDDDCDDEDHDVMAPLRRKTG